MSRKTTRVVKTPSVSTRAYDLNKFITPRVHKRSTVWFPPSAWVKLHNKLNLNLNHVFQIDPRAAKGTINWTNDDSAAGAYPYIIMNSAKPFDFWTNEVIGDAFFGDPMPALDLLSVMYKKARITSVDIKVRFMLDLPTMVGYTDSTVQAGVVRFGCYLSSSADPHAAWSQDEAGTATSDAVASGRLYEAYRAGLLTTVPLVISNRQEDMHKVAELVMRNVNIMDQFQDDETTVTGPDPTNFAFALPNLRNTSNDHVNIAHPNTKLYLHFFCMIDKPLTGLGTTSEESDIAFHSEVSITQNYLLTSPAGKLAEDENPANNT